MNSASGGLTGKNVSPDALNIAVFASGRGSNLRALIEAFHAGTISNVSISLVVSNNSTSGALELAKQHAIPAVHFSRLQFSSDEEHSEGLLQLLRTHKINFIVLAGYMKKIDSALISAFKNRIINIHPALLPGFGGKGMYGMRVHEAVIASGARISGATIHIVDDEYDRGPIIMQEQIAVSPTDTAETLAEKVLAVEHRIYPKAVNLFAHGKVIVNGRNVVIEKL